MLYIEFTTMEIRELINRLIDLEVQGCNSVELVAEIEGFTQEDEAGSIEYHSVPKLRVS